MRKKALRREITLLLLQGSHEEEKLTFRPFLLVGRLPQPVFGPSFHEVDVGVLWSLYPYCRGQFSHRPGPGPSPATVLWRMLCCFLVLQSVCARIVNYHIDNSCARRSQCRFYRMIFILLYYEKIRHILLCWVLQTAKLDRCRLGHDKLQITNSKHTLSTTDAL